MDLQKKFSELYQDIIESEDVEKMKRLGRMTKRVMRWLIREEPELAKTAIEMLDENEMQAKNYLSEEEAHSIVDKMKPQPKWTMEEMERMLIASGKTALSSEHYNRWALLTTMSMILSDSGDTLRDIVGSASHPATSEEILASVYRLAIDKLTDKDGVFNVRKYFDL